MHLLFFKLKEEHIHVRRNLKRYELYEKGLIKFNGINLNGYNYTKGANFLVVEYEVVDGGSTTPEFIWEIASDTKDNALITNHKADSSISLSASFS